MGPHSVEEQIPPMVGISSLAVNIIVPITSLYSVQLQVGFHVFLFTVPDWLFMVAGQFFKVLGWVFMVPGWFSWSRWVLIVFHGSRCVCMVFHDSRLVFHGSR